MTFDSHRMIFVWGAEATCRVRACPVNTFWCGFAPDEAFDGFTLVTTCPVCKNASALSRETKERIAGFKRVLGVNEKRLPENIPLLKCERCGQGTVKNDAGFYPTHGGGFICLGCGKLNGRGGEEE